ncbi:hypothetical protein DdX_13213 [Ditylenchus destructor]|uniref:Uncharacterized protein n=1 Tax=Ditylenchus destructor TaxID=166010 RepID=A0AAD4MZ60_9BILA|nr:hypothetical protein DdX_13213 [Ditylenchus destructor]
MKTVTSLVAVFAILHVCLGFNNGPNQNAELSEPSVNESPVANNDQQNVPRPNLKPVPEKIRSPSANVPNFDTTIHVEVDGKQCDDCMTESLVYGVEYIVVTSDQVGGINKANETLRKTACEGFNNFFGCVKSKCNIDPSEQYFKDKGVGDWKVACAAGTLQMSMMLFAFVVALMVGNSWK